MSPVSSGSEPSGEAEEAQAPVGGSEPRGNDGEWNAWNEKCMKWKKYEMKYDENIKPMKWNVKQWQINEMKNIMNVWWRIEVMRKEAWRNEEWR